MKIRLIILTILISFAGLAAQQKEGAKLQKADESGFIQVDKAPALQSKLNPVYPKDARLSGTEGTVYLKLLIDEKGNVAKAKVEKGVKDDLDNTALAAARKAKFSPAVANNKPVKVWVVLPISFKLDVEKKTDTAVSDDPDINEYIRVQKMPEIVGAGKPDYPEEAKSAGITGKVFVKVLIDKEGNPKKVVVIKSDNEIFNQSSINAAMKTKFTPALQDGKPIAVWVVLPYKFALSDKPSKEKNEIAKSDEPGIDELVDVQKLPEIVSIETPVYPEEAKKNGVEGKVFVKILVDKTGNPKKTVVIKSENEIFNHSAIDAAMKTKFTPAEDKEGKKVAIWVVLPFQFVLQDKPKDEK